MAKGVTGSWQHNSREGIYELVIRGTYTARITPSGDPYDRRCYWRLYAKGATTREAPSLYAAMRQVRRALRERGQGAPQQPIHLPEHLRERLSTWTGCGVRVTYRGEGTTQRVMTSTSRATEDNLRLCLQAIAILESVSLDELLGRIAGLSDPGDLAVEFYLSCGKAQ